MNCFFTCLYLTAASEFLRQRLVFSPPLDSSQMNNIVQTSTLIAQPYPPVGQITSPYEQQKPVKDLNKYATLKAVGKTLLSLKPR